MKKPYKKISKSITKWINDITNNEINKILFIMVSAELIMWVLLISGYLSLYLIELPYIIMGDFSGEEMGYAVIGFIPLLILILLWAPIAAISLIVLAVRTRSKILYGFSLITLFLLYLTLVLPYL